MSEIFQRNIAVLEQRWPDLLQRLLAEDPDVLDAQLVNGQGSTLSIDGIQLTSRHDRIKEAQLQADSLPPESPVLHLYGCGLGDLQRVALSSATLQRLHVYVLNGAVFTLVLQLLEQDDWLSDPRVELSYAGDHREINLPFFALPAELVLADDFNARIRDRLISEIHLTFTNRDFSAEDPLILEQLAQGMDLLRQDADVADLFGSQPGREVFVIATGPSLAQHLPRLLETRGLPERPLFICVDTAYVPLLNSGIAPDIVVSIDHRITHWHLPVYGSAQVSLVYMPRIDATLLGTWKGPRYACYSYSPLYKSVREQVPKGQLYVGGSVIHPAIDLAVRMGAARITLFGADFAFPNDKTHTGWVDGTLGPKLHQSRHWLLDGRGNRVRTQLNFRSYLIELERYIALHPEVEFFNTSRDGALITGTGFDPEWTPA
ncbi:motility associated factor glycosyltransferase family protein [Pseudomonas sp. Pseusp122]|uniref:motility associated factor glycosyltransferase family protein n=1 Tax=unclassified Pseudomonas TaxID=196821 RepID=UPI0039A477E8